MNIFETICVNNKNNGAKQVMSITTDAGVHQSYTYEQMFEAVEVFSLRLLAGGLRQGDRIIICSENSPQWNIAYLAIMKCLCTAVLIDASLPKQEISALILKSDARCAFLSPKIRETLGGIVSDTIPVLNLQDEGRPFPQHLEAVAQGILPTADGDSEIAFIIYSSGTTRTATGIMHTHEAMLGTTNAAIVFNKLNSSSKMLVCIPNSHIYGVVTSMLGPLMLGGSMHFIESMTGANVLQAFAEYQPTVFSCVPRVFEMFEKQIRDKINSNKLTASVFKLFFPLCLALRKKAGINLGKVIFKTIHEGFGGHIEIFCAAGAPMSPSTTEFYYGVGLNLFLNYGLTETNVPVIANNYENYTLTTCGKAYPHVEIKLVPLGDGQTSEIYLKTPFMMKGYFRDEEATGLAFDDGWFKTGDLGVRDQEGNISVVGRCKDNIVLSIGKKVTPEDVEAGYEGIKGVKEFAVCGIAAIGAGYDEIHGFIVRDQLSGLGEEEIKIAVYERSATLSSYKMPARLHFVEEIPKTSLQKPKRYLLKKLVLSQKAQVASEEKSVPKEADTLDILKNLVCRVNKSDTVLSEDTRIFEDLHMDSLSCIELDLLVEETFGKSISHCFNKGLTLGQMKEELKGPAKGEETLFTEKFPVQKAMVDYVIFRICCTLAHWVYHVEVKGLENLPKTDGYIICPNHQTNFDYLWIAMKFGKNQFLHLSCMAKKELFNQTWASKLLARVCGMIPIDRENHNSQAFALCKKKLAEGWNLVIYPEGTRTKDGQVGEFKKGTAMISVTDDVTIVPAKIKGGFEMYPSGKKLPRLFDFKHMRRYRIEVAFATPISGAHMDVDSLNTKLREIISGM